MGGKMAGTAAGRRLEAGMFDQLPLLQPVEEDGIQPEVTDAQEILPGETAVGMGALLPGGIRTVAGVDLQVGTLPDFPGFSQREDGNAAAGVVGGEEMILPEAQMAGIGSAGGFTAEAGNPVRIDAPGMDGAVLRFLRRIQDGEERMGQNIAGICEAGITPENPEPGIRMEGACVYAAVLRG